MAGLTWTLKLKDAMSGAAGRIATSLGRLRKALGETSAAADKVDKALSGKGNGAKGKGGKGGGKKSGLGGGFTVAKGLAVDALSSIASKFAELGRMGFEKLGDVMTGAMDKGQIMRGLGLLLGGADKAQGAFDAVAAKARQLGANTLDSARSVQALLASGFKLEGSTGALRVLEAASAIRVINPSANIDNVITALSQIQAKGKLTAEELHGQLGDAGVNIGAVYEKLSKKLGKSADEVRALMQKGKISSDMGIEAIFESIEQQGGKSLAEIAASGKGSFANMLERLQSLPQEIGARLDLGRFFASGSAAIDAIINKLTDPKAQALFDSIFNVMGAGLLDSGAGAIDKIISVLTDPRALTMLEDLSKVGSAALDGLGEGFAEMADAMLGIDSGGADNMAATWRAIGQAIGWAAGFALFFSKVTMKVVNGVSNLGKSIGEAFSAVGEALSDIGSAIGSAAATVADVVATIMGWGAAVAGFFFGLPGLISAGIATVIDMAASLGSDIVDGIVEGITSGASAVVDAIVGVAKGALSAAKAVLEIASPSKVARRDLGRNIPKGQALGIRDGTPEVESAASDMARSAASAAGSAPMAFAPASPSPVARAAEAGAFVRNSMATNTDNSRAFHIGSINVNGGPDGRSHGQAIANELRSMAVAHG